MSDLKLCFHFPVSKDSQVQVRSSSGYLTDEEIEKLIQMLMVSIEKRTELSPTFPNNTGGG